MTKASIALTLLATLLVGCSASKTKNTNIKQSPERIAYEACKKRNNGDTSKCQKEKDDLLERQEIELLDEDT